MQNRLDQFFVFLTERTAFDAENVVKRLIEIWKETDYSKDFSILYSLKSEECLKDENREK